MFKLFVFITALCKDCQINTELDCFYLTPTQLMMQLVKKCNEGARKMQQTEQLAEIASQLDYTSSVKTYALISQSRLV